MNSNRACRYFAWLAAIALALCSEAALAQTLYEKIDEYVVATDFNRAFKMKRQAKVYFKTTTLQNQNAGMKNIVGARISLSDPADAEYELHIRTEKRTNYAMRNDERIPSDAYVFFAICSVKWTEAYISRLGFKSYDQGRKKFQGTSKHLVWLDEEPPADVYDECMLRLMTTDGLMLCTFTPLEGMTEIALRFLPQVAAPAKR